MTRPSEIKPREDSVPGTRYESFEEGTKLGPVSFDITPAIVEDVMNLIVLPLSALHSAGPYELRDLLQGLLVHMVVVGLPISYSIRRFVR